MTHCSSQEKHLLPRREGESARNESKECVISRDPPLSSSFVELNKFRNVAAILEDAPRGIIKECGDNPEEVAVTLARTRFSLYSTLANAFASLTFTDAPAATVLPRARGGTPAPARENVDTPFSLSSRHRRISTTTTCPGTRDRTKTKRTTTGDHEHSDTPVDPVRPDAHDTGRRRLAHSRADSHEQSHRIPTIRA